MTAQRFLFLFCLAFTVSGIHCETYICNGEHVIDAPKDISKPWIYPDGWDGSGDAPEFSANQTCTWKITVPKGMFAFLTVTAVVDSTTLTIFDSVGNDDWVPSSVVAESYYLLDPGFKVYLDSYRSGKLGMKVTWSKMGSFNPSSYGLTPNTVPTSLQAGDYDNGAIVYSTSKVSLVSLSDTEYTEDYRMRVRNTVVFDGNDRDATLIGNLWQINRWNNHTVSSGKYLTFYSLVPNVNVNNYALVQDFENVKQFSQYEGISHYTDATSPVVLDARRGPAGSIKMSNFPHYLQGIYANGNCTYSVYTGTLEPAHLLAQYSDNSTDFPQKFTGLFTTYTLDQGIGIIYISVADKYSNWTNIPEDRKGVVVSKNLDTMSDDQDFKDLFTAGNVHNINVNVKSAHLTENAALTITVKLGAEQKFSERYTSTHLPPNQISSNGDSLSVEYTTNGSKTKGALVDFAFESGTTGPTASPQGTTSEALITSLSPSTKSTFSVASSSSSQASTVSTKLMTSLSPSTPSTIASGSSSPVSTTTTKVAPPSPTVPITSLSPITLSSNPSTPPTSIPPVPITSSSNLPVVTSTSPSSVVTVRSTRYSTSGTLETTTKSATYSKLPVLLLYVVLFRF